LKLDVTVIVIVDAEPVAVAVAPTKLIFVIPVPTDVPALLISTPLITPVRFAPEPTKLVAVTIPLEFIFPEVIFPTEILGLPDNPNDVVAKEAVDAVPVMVPVKLPTKLVAVITPALILVAPILTAFTILEEDKSRLSPEASSCI